MTLSPGNVDFKETWNKIQYTLEQVLSWSKVTRKEWNERFSYLFLAPLYLVFITYKVQ